MYLYRDVVSVVGNGMSSSLSNDSKQRHAAVPF